MVVVPTGKTFPAGTTPRLTVTVPSQLSLAVAVPRVALETFVEQALAPSPV